MREVHWCVNCGKQDYECKCTPVDLERHWDREELLRAQATVARLESKLGLSANGPTANRKQRRAWVAQGRRGGAPR